MAWNTPVSWVTNQLVTADNLNKQIYDNMLFVHSGKAITPIKRIGSAYSTTSTTLVDIDTTNLVATGTLSTGRVLLTLTGSFYADSNAGRLLILAFLVDGVLVGGVNMMREALDGNGFVRCISIATVVTGLSVGSHTFKIQWSIANGTAYLVADATAPVNFNVVEL